MVLNLRDVKDGREQEKFGEVSVIVWGREGIGMRDSGEKKGWRWRIINHFFWKILRPW